MPNRVRRNSVVDLLAKVPVNKGSLLKAIENLLKTIESSESAVMIPTLLRDKCEFDAWELLFVAKILKASILGHSDLVEFYMNHMRHNNLHSQANANQHQQAPLSPSVPTTPTTPSARQAHSSSPSPVLINGSSASSNNNNVTSTGTTEQPQVNGSAVGAIGLQQQNGIRLASQPQSPSSVAGPPMSTTNGNSAGQQQQPNALTGEHKVSSAFSPTTSAHPTSPLSGLTDTTNGEQQLASQQQQQQQQESLLAAARPLLMRQAQPPSLLQLTTTNNHINSVFTNSNIEQLTNQLSALQANGYLSQGGAAANALPSSTASDNPDGVLSISTSSGSNQQSNGSSTGGGNQLAQAGELRTSRSAGCLYRMNSSSGASSPRTPLQTPTTPQHCPQAETLANGLINGLPGDPSAPVKLLLQIEQLKSSINHVTSLLESVVELYKESIDSIALA